MNEQIWRKRKVLSTIGMGSTWLYEAVNSNEFPRPVRIGVRAIGWRKSDVMAWIEGRKVSDQNPAKARRQGGLS